MLLSVSVKTWQSEWKSMTPEAYAELRTHVPQLPEDREKIPYNEIFIVDDQMMAAFHRVGIKMEISDDPNIDTMLVKLQKRIDHVESVVRDIHQFNDRVQIAIPDQRLMMIDEVTWLEDCCTETVQEKLDDGWRIIAVCPPNAQRRPDYILGRTKK